MIKISKKDLYYSYFAQFLNIGSGIVILPLILKLLSTEEIGFNYILLTVGSLVTLFDFGFVGFFGQNITYIFSGAQKLKKEGVDGSLIKGQINYKLLSTMIETARFVYKRLSVAILLFLMIFGTIYIHRITRGFTTINSSLTLWILYSLSVFFNIYYSYYRSLLIGKGLVKELQKVIIWTKLFYLFFVFLFLFLGFGLFSVVIGSLINPFINKFFSHYYFFTPEIKSNIKKFNITIEEKAELFKIIWFNSKKIGIINIAASSLGYLTMFILGLYFTLNDVASFGLMLQLLQLVAGISLTFFSTFSARIAYLHLQNDKPEFDKCVSISFVSFYFLFILGSIFLIVFVPYILENFNSNANLPSRIVMLVSVILMLFEKNQSLFSQLLLINNEVPFLKSSIITGTFSILFVFFFAYHNLGLLSIVLAQGLPNLFYSCWKWPLEALRKFKINFVEDILLKGSYELLNELNILWKKI